MKKSLFFILFSLITLLSFAQEGQKTTQPNDTTKNISTPIGEVSDTYLKRARIYALEKQYEEAYLNYLKAVNTDSLNPLLSLEVARFCDAKNQTERAIRFYQQTLKNTKRETSKIGVLNNLGALLIKSNHHSEALEYLLQGLKIFEQLPKSQVQSQSFDSEIASIQVNLGVLYSNQDKNTKAAAAYNEALFIYERLAKQNGEKHHSGKALVLMNLGILKKQLGKFTEAKASYLQAISIFEQLAEQNSQEYEFDLARTRMNLGAMYNALYQ